MFSPGGDNLSNRWQSVRNGYRMWPGEYQSAEDSCGKPLQPWGGMNMHYFECCTGTPFVDAPRASAFIATELSLLEIAGKLVRSPSLQGRGLQTEVCLCLRTKKYEMWYPTEGVPSWVSPSFKTLADFVRASNLIGDVCGLFRYGIRPTI